MQDNPFDEQFMDQAWGQMKMTLDQEMPERRKKRLFLWWWLLPALLLVIGLSAYAWQKDRLNKEPLEISAETPIASIDIATSKEERNPQNTSNSAVEESAQKKEASPKINHPELATPDQPPSTESQTNRNTNGPRNPSATNQGLEQQLITEPTVAPIASNTTRPELNNNPMSSQQESEREVRPLPRSLLPLFEPLPSILVNLDMPVHKELNWPSFAQKSNQYQLWVNGHLATSLDANQQNSLGLGITYIYPIQRLQIGFGLKAQSGRGVIETATSDKADFVSNAEEADPLGSFADPVEDYNIDQNFSTPQAFRFQSLKLSGSLTYRWHPRWSSVLFVEAGQLLGITAQNQIEDNQLLDLGTNRNGTQEVQAPSELEDLFESKTVIDWGLGIRHQWNHRFSTDLQYQLGQSNLIVGDRFEWQRNRLILGLNYRIK